MLRTPYNFTKESKFSTRKKIKKKDSKFSTIRKNGTRVKKKTAKFRIRPVAAKKKNQKKQHATDCIFLNKKKDKKNDRSPEDS